VDTTALPDGVYRFLLTASDEPNNAGAALATTARSRWFTVDNAPPRIEIEDEGSRWTLRVSDDASSIIRVEWSRNGERWERLAPEDGVLDGTTEIFALERREGTNLLVVRAIDRHHNRATEGVVEE
jgi:hypothetical protein